MNNARTMRNMMAAKPEAILVIRAIVARGEF